LPTLEELFDAIGKAKVFSSLDLKSRYHQLPLRLEDRMKTTFWGVDDDRKICFSIGSSYLWLEECSGKVPMYYGLSLEGVTICLVLYRYNCL